MIKLFALALLSLAGVAHALSLEEIQWRTEYDAALTEAKQDHKPIVLDFTATWCGPCRMMEATTFADPAVRKTVKSYVTVRIDYDRNPELVGKFAIRGVPTLFILNQFGESVASTVGYQDARHLLDWLTANQTEATATVSKAETASAQVRALDLDLQSTDPADRERGVAKLLEGYLSKGEFAAAAELKLEELVNLRPAEMLPHLNDPHLAARILLARHFAQKLGADFTFDPWDSQEARAAVVALWQTKLAVPR